MNCCEFQPWFRENLGRDDMLHVELPEHIDCCVDCRLQWESQRALSDAISTWKQVKFDEPDLAETVLIQLMAPNIPPMDRAASTHRPTFSSPESRLSHDVPASRRQFLFRRLLPGAAAALVVITILWRGFLPTVEPPNSPTVGNTESGVRLTVAITQPSPNSPALEQLFEDAGAAWMELVDESVNSSRELSLLITASTDEPPLDLSHSPLKLASAWLDLWKQRWKPVTDELPSWPPPQLLIYVL